MSGNLKRFLLIMLSAGVLAGQQQVQIANPCLQNQCFVGIWSGTVNASASTTVTVQEPTTPKQIQFVGAVIQCPGQTFTTDQAQNGSAATATFGTATPMVPTTAVSAAKLYTASNVGAGTTVAPAILSASGTVQFIDLTQRMMNAAGQNYSVKLTNTGAGSCAGSVALYWAEKQ